MENAPEIFISWSGDLSRAIAQELRSWLPYNLDRLDLWMSSEDLAEGKRWSMELFEKLGRSHFGILVVTPDSMLSPWMMFEAGALSKDLTIGRVLPYLVGVRPSELEGPLRSFQSVSADEQGTLRLLKAINDASGIGAAEEILHDRFKLYWPRFSDFLASINLDDSSKGSSDPLLSNGTVSRLEAQLAEMTNMIRELTSIWSPRPDSGSIGTVEEDRVYRLKMEGAWAATDSGTRMYVRSIGRELYAPYSYGPGTDELTGVYYGWKRVGDYWFGRFRWIYADDIHGFGLYRILSDNVLEGAWWFDEDAEPDLQAIARDGLESRPGGNRVRLERVKDSTLPIWAEEYFASVK